MHEGTTESGCEMPLSLTAVRLCTTTRKELTDGVKVDSTL